MATRPSALIREAEALARRLLAEEPDRLSHSRYAAVIADMAADVLGIADADPLVAAAWLHDIGYSSAVVQTGFHPLDGALRLAADGWPDQTVLLVAHHSHAAVLAPYFDVEHQLAVLDHVPGDAEDVLTYADLRSGPTGMGATPKERIAEMRRRHFRDGTIPDAVNEGRYRLLLNAADRISAALNARPVTGSGRRRPHPASVIG